MHATKPLVVRPLSWVDPPVVTGARESIAGKRDAASVVNTHDSSFVTPHHFFMFNVRCKFGLLSCSDKNMVPGLGSKGMLGAL